MNLLLGNPTITSTSYRWCDPVIWREQSRFHLTESQEDQPAQGASAASGKPDAEPSTSTAETLPETLSELNLSKSPETTERATSPMDTAEAGETPLSQPINIPELDPSAVRARMPSGIPHYEDRTPLQLRPNGENLPPLSHSTEQENMCHQQRNKTMSTLFLGPPDSIRSSQLRPLLEPSGTFEIDRNS